MPPKIWNPTKSKRILIEHPNVQNYFFISQKEKELGRTSYDGEYSVIVHVSYANRMVTHVINYWISLSCEKAKEKQKAFKGESRVTDKHYNKVYIVLLYIYNKINLHKGKFLWKYIWA